jgi:hypothetical protein
VFLRSVTAVFLGQTGRVLVTCDEIQLLLPEYLVSAMRDPEVDWDEVSVHLQLCPTCAEECEQTRWLIGLLRSNADMFSEYLNCTNVFTKELEGRWTIMVT